MVLNDKKQVYGWKIPKRYKVTKKETMARKIDEAFGLNLEKMNERVAELKEAGLNVSIDDIKKAFTTTVWSFMKGSDNSNPHYTTENIYEAIEKAFRSETFTDREKSNKYSHMVSFRQSQAYYDLRRIVGYNLTDDALFDQMTWSSFDGAYFLNTEKYTLMILPPDSPSGLGWRIEFV